MQGIIKIGTALVDKGFKEGAKKLKAEAITTDKEITKILSNSTKASKNLGNALGGVTKKATNLGSALFNVVAVGGLMGAVGLGAYILGKALDKANGSTEQLKTNLSYIGFVASKIFENLLQPAIDKTTGAVNGLVGALYKAVVYIGYILSKWTGKDLFKGTSAKDYAVSMEKANKSAKGTAKATKQIKKDLMVFDEVNKLSENTTSSSGGGVGGVGGVSTPNLPNLGDVKIPKWVEWIADHKDVILKVAGVLLALLTFNKVVSWLQPLGSFFGLFTGGKLGKALGGVLGTLGSIVAIAGSLAMIGYSVYDLLEGNKKQRKDINKMTKKGVEYAKQDAKEFKNMDELQEALNYKRKQSNKLLDEANTFSAWITDTSSKLLKNMNGVVEQQDIYLQEQISAYKQGKLNKDDQEKLKQILLEQTDYLQIFGDRLDAQGKDSKYIRDLGAEYRDILGEMGVKIGNMGTPFERIKEKTKSMQENIGNVVKGMSDLINKNIPKKDLKIDVKADTSKAQSSLGSMISSIGTKLSKAFSSVDLSGLVEKFVKMFNGLNKNFGFKLNVDNVKKKLGLRQGGIINNPGKGIALGGNIIGGEAGAEAVLPLDDTTMDRLGSAIARHMVINTTNINQINGRTLSREVKQIMNENEFASNI